MAIVDTRVKVQYLGSDSKDYHTFMICDTKEVILVDKHKLIGESILLPNLCYNVRKLLSQDFIVEGFA